MNVNTLIEYLGDSDIKGDEEIVIYRSGEPRPLQSVKLVKNLRGNKVKTLNLS